MGAALALLSIFFIQQNQDGLHIDSAVLKMAIKSLFLYQFPCVIYHFFQNFVLFHMFPFLLKSCYLKLLRSVFLDVQPYMYSSTVDPSSKLMSSDIPLI